MFPMLNFLQRVSNSAFHDVQYRNEVSGRSLYKSNEVTINYQHNSRTLQENLPNSRIHHPLHPLPQTSNETLQASWIPSWMGVVVVGINIRLAGERAGCSSVHKVTFRS